MRPNRIDPLGPLRAQAKPQPAPEPSGDPATEPATEPAEGETDKSAPDEAAPDADPAKPEAKPEAKPDTDAEPLSGPRPAGRPCESDADCAGSCKNGACKGDAKRTNALLWQSKTRPDGSGYRYFIPFWWQTFSKTKETKILAPIFVHQRDERRGLTRLFTLPFVYRQTERDRDRDLLVVGPFFRDADRSGSTVGLFPLFFTFNDKKARARTTLFFPIVGAHSSPDSAGAFVGPAYGYRGSHGWAGGLFPLFMFGRVDGREHHVVLPPLFVHTKDARSDFWLGGPFYFRRTYDEANPADPAKKGWDTGLLPLFVAGRRAESSYASVALLYHYRGGPGRWTHVLGPAYAHKSPDGYAGGLAPLVNFSKSASGRTEWVAPPLYLHWSNPDKTKLFTMFGPVFRSRSGERTVQGVFPLVWNVSEGPRNFGAFFPLWAHRSDSSRGISDLQIGPYLRLKNEQKQSTTHVLLPLFVKHDSPDYAVTTLLPLFLHTRDHDATALAVLPLYYRVRKPTLGADVFFPLVWHFTRPQKQEALTVVGNVYHRRDPEGADTGVAPLFGWGRRAAGDKLYAWSLPLLFFHQRDREAQTSRTILGPFYMDRNKSDWTGVAFPLFAGWRRGATMRAFGPVYFHTQDDEAQTDFTFAGPAYWGKNLKHKYGGLFPLFWYFGGRAPEDKTWSATFLPLFHIARKADGGHRVWTLPLIGWSTSPTGTRALVFPFYVRRAQEGSTFALLPLFWHSQEKTGRSMTWLLPLFLRRKTPESHLLGITPLVWYHRDVVSRTVLVLPLFFDKKKDFESRTTGVLPFFIRHVNHASGTRMLIIPPALLYYRTTPTDKDVVVFPLFWHLRSGEKLTQLLFPIYLHMKRAKWDHTVVANIYVKTGKGDLKGAWSFHFFPIFNFGRPRPGDWEWGLFGGLIGYERNGRRRTLKLIWSYEFPLAPVPAPTTSNYGRSPLASDPPGVFY